MLTQLKLIDLCGGVDCRHLHWEEAHCGGEIDYDASLSLHHPGQQELCHLRKIKKNNSIVELFITDPHK